MSQFKGREDQCSQSISQRANSPSLCRSVLFRPSTDWMTATHTESTFFTQDDAKLFRSHLTDMWSSKYLGTLQRMCEVDT